jgi:protein required for attachment to host cells
MSVDAKEEEEEEDDMANYLVFVADGARARILSFEPARDPRSTARLVEHVSLVNPEHELEPHHRFTGQRSESRGHVLGHWYGTDDHRLRQDEEHVRRFARQAASEAARLARELGAKHLSILAPARMLGFIRSEAPGLFKLGLEIREEPTEVTRLSLPRLQEHLQEKDLIPKSRARTSGEEYGRGRIRRTGCV